MRPERWRQIEDLYHAALQVEPEQRAAFLDNACLLDSDVKREVESLLSQSLSTSHGPLDRPAWENRADLLVDSITSWLPAGLQVGPYRIEAPLGAGGMGVVYKALDTKLNRPVAIKFVADPVTNVTTRHRFQLEARVASSLNHPHIVTVHDAGDFAERQYLVTEFIDGVTLKEWGDWFDSEASTPHAGVEASACAEEMSARSVVGRDLIVGTVVGALTVGLMWLGYGEGAWPERRCEPAIPPTD